MPMFIAVSMIEDEPNARIFNDVSIYVEASEAAAIEKARADISARHGGMKLLNGSVIQVKPETVAEAYVDLSRPGVMQ